MFIKKISLLISISLLVLINGLTFSAYDDVYSYSQLTTPGVTETIPVYNNTNHVVQYTVSGISNNVVCRIEGSIDATATNYFNLNDLEQNTTVNSNGTYKLYKSNIRLNYLRFRFVSEDGDKTATINAVYGGN